MANSWDKKLRKGSRVQSVLFDKAHFTLSSARKWLKENKFKDLKVDETDKYYRFRQQNPDNFIDSSFRTKTITSGIKLIVGIPMKKNRRKDDFIQHAFEEIDEHGTEGSFTRYVARNFKGKNDPDKRRRVAKEIKRSYEAWVHGGKKGNAPYSLTTYRRAVFYLNIQKRNNPSTGKTIIEMAGKKTRDLQRHAQYHFAFKDNDEYDIVSMKDWLKSPLPNVASDYSQKMMKNILLHKAKKSMSFGRLMDFNRIKNFEDQLKWFSQNGINVTKRGISSKAFDRRNPHEENPFKGFRESFSAGARKLTQTAKDVANREKKILKLEKSKAKLEKEFKSLQGCGKKLGIPKEQMFDPDLWHLGVDNINKGVVEIEKEITKLKKQRNNPSMPQWAKIIVQQLGGFRRLSLMLGVKQVFYDSENKTVQFRFPNKKTSKPNVVSVMYVPDTDLYQMDFYRVGKKKGRSYKTVLATYEDVYNDMLIPLFEQETGLYLRFNNNPQETLIAELLPSDFYIKVLFDNDFQTSLGAIIRDNLEDGVDPVLHQEAEIIRNLQRGQSDYLGMIEITRL